MMLSLENNTQIKHVSLASFYDTPKSFSKRAESPDEENERPAPLIGTLQPRFPEEKNWIAS